MYEERNSQSTSTEETLQRLGRWLKTRPLENWGFFAAGVIVARILF